MRSEGYYKHRECLKSAGITLYAQTAAKRSSSPARRAVRGRRLLQRTVRPGIRLLSPLADPIPNPVHVAGCLRPLAQANLLADHLHPLKAKLLVNLFSKDSDILFVPFQPSGFPLNGLTNERHEGIGVIRGIIPFASILSVSLHEALCPIAKIYEKES
jgi:hypothetical protein